MTKIQKCIWGSIVLGTLIYLFSPGLAHVMENPSGWDFQAQFMYLTGICAMVLIIVSMLISLRIPKFNSFFGGLDKAYNVHKWMGIFTTVFVALHWLGDKIPLLLVKLGLVPEAEVDIKLYSKLEIALYKTGTLAAELIFYVFVFLIVVSLSNKISYTFFRKTHNFIPGVFLIYAYHGATAPLKDHWYKTPAVYLVLVLIGVGSVIAFLALFQQIGKARKVKARIKSITQHETGVLDIHLETIDKPFNHQAGQYAFLQFAHSKEPHPFTISSSGGNPDTLRFSIKELGDFTRELNSNISIGQQVQVEGPYGEFKFEDNCQSQVWIAGGIGITPFMAQLEYLSNNGGTKKPVDFWYCTNGDLEQQFPASLRELCTNAGVNLHHLNANMGNFFNIDMLQSRFDHLQNSSIWFCGPLPLKSIINEGLKSIGYNMRNFHFDNFSMR